jgi:hypothetical protein
MAAKKLHSERAQSPATASIENTVGRGGGIVQHWRELSAKRKRARRVSARNRRVLAKWLRRTANHAHATDSTLEEPLHYRAAAVRTELLELAAILEHAHDPDPASVAALCDLLADSRGSPLYNPNIPAADLDEALRRIRTGLANAPPA